MPRWAFARGCRHELRCSGFEMNFCHMRQKFAEILAVFQEFLIGADKKVGRRRRLLRSKSAEKYGENSARR